MTLTNVVSQVFKSRVEGHAFFDGWEPVKPRGYRRRDEAVHLGIELQLDKWWTKDGGKVAVNLWCGHRWNVPPPGWLEDGFDLHSDRLRPEGPADHWWQIASKDDTGRFGGELQDLLVRRGIPWLEQVSTKEGFLAWCSASLPGQGMFPYLLELRGRSATIQAVCDWLRTAPRRIEPQLRWLVTAGLLPEDLSRRLLLASLQSEDVYRARMEPLICEVGQPTGESPEWRLQRS